MKTSQSSSPISSLSSPVAFAVTAYGRSSNTFGHWIPTAARSLRQIESLRLERLRIDSIYFEAEQLTKFRIVSEQHEHEACNILHAAWPSKSGGSDYERCEEILGVVKDGEKFDFCMCNPPLFETINKAGLNPKTTCGATKEEMVCPGGEQAFILALLKIVQPKQAFRGYACFVNIRDGKGGTPLYLATNERRSECVHALLQLFRCSDDAQRFMHWASRK